MATYYWVGGTGNWSSTGTDHWATSSGGTGGAGIPSGVNDAIFDANSNNTNGNGDYVVTATDNVNTNSLTLWNPASGVVSLIVNKNVTLGDGHSYFGSSSTNTPIISGNGATPKFFLGGSSSHTSILTTNGTVIRNIYVEIFCNGGITVTDSFIGDGTRTLIFDNVGSSGTVDDFSGTTISGWSYITFTGNATYTANFTGATINIPGYFLANPSGLTINLTNANITASYFYFSGIAGLTTTGSTLTMTGSSVTFTTGNFTYNNVICTGTSITITGTSNFTGNFTCPSTSSMSSITAGSTMTVAGTLTLGGISSASKATVQSSSSTVKAYLVAGDCVLSNLIFKNIIATGPFVGTNLENYNNSNIGIAVGNAFIKT